MITPILTQNDLDRFKQDVISEIKALIQNRETETKKWIKNNEVKKMLDISHSTLQSLRANGTLSYTKVGGTIYYDIEEIEKILEENKISNRI